MCILLRSVSSKINQKHGAHTQFVHCIRKLGTQNRLEEKEHYNSIAANPAWNEETGELRINCVGECTKSLLQRKNA